MGQADTDRDRAGDREPMAFDGCAKPLEGSLGIGLIDQIQYHDKFLAAEAE